MCTCADKQYEALDQGYGDQENVWPGKCMTENCTSKSYKSYKKC